MKFLNKFSSFKYLSILMILAIFGSNITNVQTQEQKLSFPNDAPFGQVRGGYFAKYFENIFGSGGFYRSNTNGQYSIGTGTTIVPGNNNLRVCPDNEAIVGFSYDGNIIPSSIANPATPITNGIPICAKVTTADGNASGFTGALVGKDNYLPVYSSGGRLLTTSIVTQNLSPFSNTQTGANIEGHLLLGPFVGNSIDSGEGFGSRLFYEGANVNTEYIYTYRYNRSNYASWLRTVIGNADPNSIYSGFVLGRSNSGDRVEDRFTNSFLPFFTVAVGGKMVLSNDVNDHALTPNSPSLFVKGKGHFTDDLSTSGALTAVRDITTLSGNFSAPNGGLTVKNDIRTTNGDIFGRNFVASGSITASGNIVSTNGGLTVKNDIRTTNGNIYTNNIFATGTIHSTGGITTSSGIIATRDIRTTNGNIIANNGNLHVRDIYASGNINGSGNLTIGRDIRGNNIYATGTIHSTGGISTRGNITASGNLTVGGTTTTNNLNVNSGATIGGPLNITRGPLVVSGAITATEIKLTGSGGFAPPPGTGTGKIMITSPTNPSKTEWLSTENLPGFKDAMKRFFPDLCDARAGYSLGGNTCYGKDALASLNMTYPNPVSNSAFGDKALNKNTTGSANSAFGRFALEKNTTASDNSAFGMASLKDNVTGTNNVAVGNSSSARNISGNYNVAVGSTSFFKNTTGSNNVAIGSSSLIDNTTGSNNVVIGSYGGWVLDSAIRDGITTGSNNIVIGSKIRIQNGTASNQLNIGNWIYGSGGNIGIGVNNPRTKFVVEGMARIVSNGTTNNHSTIQFYNTDHYGYAIGKDPANEFFLNYDNRENVAERNILKIKNNGNIGIGTQTPSEKLEVNGNVKATAYLYTSDERLKTNVMTLDSALDKILSLRGVEFDWRDTGRKTIGFIAQEVEKVLPELVHTDSNGYKSIEYANITAVLVEAIKSQQSQISDLQNRLDNQEKLLLDLQNQINDLKKQR